MKYTAVIFDMDGTIIHSDAVWDRALHELLQARAIPVTSELKEYFNARLHGVDIKAACSIIKDHMGLSDSVEDLVHEKRTLANMLYPQEVSFVDGFVAFHEKLLDHNCAVGIATNANACTVQATDKALNLIKFFGEHIYTIDHVQGRGKPDPLLFLHAAKNLGHQPEKCIVIEDSPHGIAAAKKAGMFCVGINTALRPESLQQADRIINHYDELDVQTLLYGT